MGSSSEKNVDVIQKAIRQLLAEEQEIVNTKISSSHDDDENFLAVDDDHDDDDKALNTQKAGGHNERQLLAKLLSQLESVGADNNHFPRGFKKEANIEETLSSGIDENIKTLNEVDSDSSNEEIIRELKKIKRQNLITHCLLTAMIVLTLAWQVSEVSLILKIKDGLSHPLRSISGIFKGFLRSSGQVNNVQNAIKEASEKQKQVTEPTSLPSLKIPELLPHLEFPVFETTDEEE